MLKVIYSGHLGIMYVYKRVLLWYLPFGIVSNTATSLRGVYRRLRDGSFFMYGTKNQDDHLKEIMECKCYTVRFYRDAHHFLREHAEDMI